ncbi:MAG: fused MFS/spermidine synthase [Myxococcota bacterium]|nr:fused MFS/spermidine synthase [Myxococcota bacterium]
MSLPSSERGDGGAILSAVTIGLGASLYFLVQPLLGKVILPWYGGDPGVWLTCLLFFQLLLLAGYAYAHLICLRLPIRGQVGLHVTLIVLALLTLPLLPGPEWKPAPTAPPAWSTLKLLVAAVGLPGLVLAATSPLIQAWRCHLAPGKPPWRLFALSNVASLLALLAYPFVLEPLISRSNQGLLWGIGLGAYGAICAVVGAQVWRTPEGSEPTNEETRPTPTWTARLLWLLLPVCSSILLMATTNKICLDIASVPFLWILPLSVYLLSWILCFDHPRWYDRRWAGPLLLVSWGVVAWLSVGEMDVSLTAQLAAHTATLFVGCMVCHGELYDLRPPADQLTGYYLISALGGALGGAFVTFGAPAIFDHYWELYVGLALSGLLFMGVCYRDTAWFSYGRRFAAGTGVLALVLANQAWSSLAAAPGGQETMVNRHRNFFGVLTVVDRAAEEQAGGLPAHRVLVDDLTEHGLQLREPGREMEPTLYFEQGTGVQEALALARARSGEASGLRIGVVGLGIGTLAAYGQEGDELRFYELNPAVITQAQESFTFLRDSAATVTVVPGDGRLALERETTDPPFDVLVLDAFSGDAPPVHLLTLEAFQLYRARLRPDGLLVVDCTNRTMDLLPVLARIAKEESWSWTVHRHRWMSDPDRAEFTWSTFSNPDAVTPEAPLPGAPIEPSRLSEILDTAPLWTDDYTSLFPLLR